VQEFGGVLAHELGHFAQGLGMRLSYLVRAIVGWFVRVVYQRDQWDEFLETSSRELDIRIGWIFLVAELFVMLGRGLLWVLFHIGLAVSGIMLRQMEYDADRYETRLAGSTAFANTARKLHLLNFASNVAHSQLSSSLDLRKLVDNLPGLICYHAHHISKEAMPLVELLIAESRTGWFDSHPCDKDRIAASEKLGSQGIFRSQRPAADLFSDFKAQSAGATWDLYVGVFGPKVPRTALQPLKEYVVQHKLPGMSGQ
jgi:Zn-dependent protease with chaperone function